MLNTKVHKLEKKNNKIVGVVAGNLSNGKYNEIEIISSIYTNFDL